MVLSGILLAPSWALAAKKKHSKTLSASRFFSLKKTEREAMGQLNQACFDEMKSAKKQMKAVTQKDDKAATKKAQKKYQKNLKAIQRQCKASRIELSKKYSKVKLPIIPKEYQPKKKSTQKKKKDTSPSSNYEAELAELKSYCEESKKYVQKKFHKRRRQIDRILGSLGRSESEKRKKLKKARNDLAKELKTINKECQKQKRLLTKDYLRQQSEYVPPRLVKKPDPKPKKKKEPAKFSKTLRENIRFSGSFRQETAVRLVSPREMTKNRSQLKLRQRVSLGDNMSLRLSQRATYDSVFDLTDNYADNVADDQQTLLEFRDAYLDYSHGDFDIRLGNQQIVWGETVGLFIADIVNAKDFREFILPEFDEIRLHQVSMEIARSKGAMSQELIVTDPRFDKIGVAGSEFEFPSPIPDGVTSTQENFSEPGSNAKNLELGARISYLIGGLDLGAFYLYGWNKLPVFFRTVTPSGLHYTPEYKRQNSAGLTFSQDISEAILKGEMVYQPSSYFPTEDLADLDGVARRDVMNYVLGLDYTYFDKYETNFQFIQQRILGRAENLINAESTRSYGSFWIKSEYNDGKIEPEILVLGSLTDSDLMVRPKVAYRWTDHLLLTVGVDVFDGNPNSGFFGIFHNKDRGYANLEFFF